MAAQATVTDVTRAARLRFLLQFAAITLLKAAKHVMMVAPLMVTAAIQAAN